VVILFYFSIKKNDRKIKNRAKTKQNRTKVAGKKSGKYDTEDVGRMTAEMMQKRRVLVSVLWNRLVTVIGRLIFYV
jgi:hypothetical protein